MKAVRSMTVVILLILSFATLFPVTGAHAQDDCTAAPAPRLAKGQTARVTVGGGTGNNLRATPSSTGTVWGVMPEGEIVTVTSDVQCVEGYNWWQVRRWDGQSGFTAEGAGDEYWLEPWPQDGAAIPTVTPPAADTGRIAFISMDANDRSQLVVMAPDGSQPTPVSGSVAHVTEAAWSPDGTRLVFAGGADPTGMALYVVDADGQNLAALPGTFAAVGGPQWSPDGTRLLFAAADAGATAPSLTDIYTLNADGTGLTNLTNTPDARDYGAVWAPDGTQIAFTTETDDNADVMVIDPGGTGAVVIGGSDADEFKPAWTPDGSRVAYYVAGDGDQITLMISNSIGTSSAPLVTFYDARGTAAAPAFSPDGTRIAYTGAATPETSDTSELFSIQANGSDPIQYTVDGAIAIAPQWSPDGEWLVFSSSRGDGFDLWAMRASGAGIAPLTSGDDAYMPLWSASTTALPTATETPGQPAVTTVPGEAELLLVYDASVPVFTLKNQSDVALNLLPVSFSGAGVVVPASIWNTEFLASPLNAFKAGGCLQMWQFGLPQQDAPADCGDSRQGWISEETGFFWTQGTFDVLYDGAVVATCETGAGRCEVDLPIVQPVG